MRYEFRPSAFRHGLTQDAIITAWNIWIGEFIERDDPLKITRIGFGTTHLLPLEVTAEITEDDVIVIFHAMPARPKYLDQCKRRPR